MVHEDHERDFLKDVIYLQERVLDLEKEVLDFKGDLDRFDAKIFIIKEKEKEYDSKVGLNVLPF
jgi:hypothetical protein